VLEAIDDATVIVLAPSNPLVSIDPILAIPGVRTALCDRRENVVAISPIVAGKALKGPADRLLRELGGEPSAFGVAQHHAEVAATIVIDEEDGDLAGAITDIGVRAVVTDTIMRDRFVRAELARTTLDAMR
jgi:LPPG:FO 2-phospho-L-lactate transferase